MLKRIQNNIFLKTLTFVLIMAIVSMTIPFNLSYAQTNPMTSLIGIRFYPEDSMKFSFFFDQLPVSSEDMAQKEAKRFIEYFLAGLTIPEQDWWVNLSAYESDRVIPVGLGFTKAGQDMLNQDYVLKQAASSLTHPDTPLGQQFWHQVYDLAEQKFGTVDIPIDVFNKVWIVPEKAIVYQESQQALLGDIRFQVMMETDYLATMKEQGLTDILSRAPEKVDSDLEGIVQKITKEIIIPVLEKEVNQGDAFLILRQVFQALVLSTWFKDYIKEHIVSKVYADQQKITGIADDTQEKIEKTYQEYLQAYQSGAYHLIREEMGFEQDNIPRRYFSGGLSVGVDGRLPLGVRSGLPTDASQRLTHSSEVAFHLTPVQDSAEKTSAPISTLLATTAVQSGPGQIFIIKKDTLNPKERKVMGFLMSLDFLVEVLDEILPPATFRQRLGWGKQSPREAMKNLIKDIGADFKANENNEQYDIQTSILSLIESYEKKDFFSNIAVGTESLQDIIRRTIAEPYDIPMIEGIAPEKIREMKDQQYGKFTRIFDFIVEEVLRKSEGEANVINTFYQRMLMSIRSSLFQGLYIPKTILNHLDRGKDIFQALEQSKVIQEVLPGEYALSKYYVNMKNSFLNKYPDLEEYIEEIWTLLKTEQQHRDNNYTAEGYVHLMMEHLRFLIHSSEQRIEDDLDNTQLYKNITGWRDVLSILETVADSVIADWNWYTLELKQIVYNLSYQKFSRAYDFVSSYQEKIWEDLEGGQAAVFQEQGGIVASYLIEMQKILKNLLEEPTEQNKEALGKKTDSQVNGYAYFITQQAVNNVLDKREQALQDQYRPLLKSLGDLIIRHAETELPSVSTVAGDVTIVTDGLLTPTKYQELHDYFQGKLKNIVLIGDLGGLTAHFALLAKADNVGTIIINEEKSRSLLEQMSSGEEVVVWQEDDQTFLQKKSDAEGKADNISKKQEIQNFFMDLKNFNRWFHGRTDLPYVLTNADTPEAIEEANQRGSKGTGLVRTENLLADHIPTRIFWREQFLGLSKAAGNLLVVIRAIDLQQDKLPLMLSHIEISQGQRFYFEHSIGREVFKEQIRALLDVRATGAENLRLLFPMIHHLEDWNHIQNIIQEVLQEPDFQFLRGRFPISMGVMIETKEAFEHFESLLKNPRIHAFSVGTNDLTADVYQVSRLDPQSGHYFEQINPRIIKMMIEMLKQIHSDNQNKQNNLQADIPSKGFRICGDLASHPLFWLIQYMLRQQGLKVDVSMPSTSIPLFNAFHLFLNNLYQQEKEARQDDFFVQDNLSLALFDLINKISQEQSPMENIDNLYREDLNQLLRQIAQLAEEFIFEKIENSDASEITLPKGGIDLRAFRNSLQYERSLDPIAVTTPQGEVQTIGGRHFQGFSFEITNIRI